MVRHGDPFSGEGGSQVIEVAIISMVLHSVSPVTVQITESPTLPSPGHMESPGGTPQGPFFPAESFFDVFLEVDIPGVGVLHNNQPAHYQGSADSFFDVFVELSAPVPLLDEPGNEVGMLNGGYMRLTPEPSGLLALAGGLVPLGFALRRRMKK